MMLSAADFEELFPTQKKPVCESERGYPEDAHTSVDDAVRDAYWVAVMPGMMTLSATLAAMNAYDFGPDVADVLAEFMAANGPVTPYVDGRITRK